MRFIAFFIVFANHANIVPLNGGVGVTVFFFLSGFLITTLLRVEHERTGTISIKSFYLRRALRILPPLYACVIAAIILTATGALVLKGSLNPVGIISEFLNFQNYYTILQGRANLGLPIGTNQLWSLAVEEHFYLLFPLFFMFMIARRPRQIKACLAGLIVADTIWRCYLVYDLHFGYDRLYLATDTRFDSLLFGCLLAVWHNPALDDLTVDEKLLKWFLFPAGIIVVVATLRWNGYDPSQLAFGDLVDGLALVPVFIVIIRWPGWSVNRVLNWRWFSYLGVLSYSSYLLHHMAIFVMDRLLSSATDREIAVPAFLLTIAGAWLFHVAIERPSNKLRHRLEAVKTGRNPAASD